MGLLLARKLDAQRLLRLVRDLRQEVAYDIEAATFLVIGVRHVPRCPGCVRRQNHRVTCPRVVEPVAVRLQVHRRQLPGLPSVVDPTLESSCLFFPTDLQPVLQQIDPGVDHHFLDHWSQLQKALRLLRGAKTHDPLYTSAVVPAAVEDHDLPGCRKVRDVALHIQLSLLTLRGRWQGNDPEDSWADSLGQSLDSATLTGGVPSLKDDADAGSGGFDPLLHRNQLDLQLTQLVLVHLSLHALNRGDRQGVIGHVCCRLMMLRLAHDGQPATTAWLAASAECPATFRDQWPTLRRPERARYLA